jgi:hypothetical protein
MGEEKREGVKKKERREEGGEMITGCGSGGPILHLGIEHDLGLRNLSSNNLN